MSITKTNSILKRLIDIVVILLVFIPAFMLVLFFAIMIMIDIGCQPFFVQRRGITKSRTFLIFKLRTLKNDENTIVDIFNKSDIHTTKFCSWLRRTGMDELPQIINILKGDMSLVGPRPFSLNDLDTMQQKMPEYYKRRCLIKSKPGLTGLWQIYGERRLGASNLLCLEEEYERTQNIWLDLRLIFVTMPALIARNQTQETLSNNVTQGFSDI